MLGREKNESGALSATPHWNATAAAVADALPSMGAGPDVRVTRELDLRAMTEMSHANSWLVVSQDGAESGTQ